MRFYEATHPSILHPKTTFNSLTKLSSALVNSTKAIGPSHRVHMTCGGLCACATMAWA